MITNLDIKKIYDWAKETEFPLKKVPTAGEYSNKDIHLCWLKGAGKKVLMIFLKFFLKVKLYTLHIQFLMVELY